MNALKKPLVQVCLFLLVVGGAITAYLLSTKKGAAPTDAAKPTASGTAASTAGAGSTDTKAAAAVAGAGASQTFNQNNASRLVLPGQKAPQVALAPAPAGKGKGAAKPPQPKLAHFSRPLPKEKHIPAAPKTFAPRGLLIKAALVITVDSSSLKTPVLAMVTEDCYYRGKLMAPAGVQVHAQATGGRVRDRLEINGAFTFVWADGREYQISGIALDHSRDEDGTFSITDGSAGIRGMVLKTDQYAEMKLLLSEAISAIAQNSQERVQSIYGLVPTNTANNASLAGASGAATGYANLLAKKIERDLEYVRVAAGTQFYIFTQDMFEPDLASVGGIKQGNAPKNSMQLAKEAYDADAAAAASAPMEQGSLGEGDTAGRLKLQRESQAQAARLGSYLSPAEAAAAAEPVADQPELTEQP